MLLILVLAIPSAALAHESEPQHVVLVDEASLFDGAELDSGWLPSSSPLAVRFQLESTGGAIVEMEGDSEMTWPDVLQVGFTGEPGTGLLFVDAGIDTVTSIKFDIDIYSWESEIDRRGVSFAAGAEFDPFLLDGAAQDSVTVSGADAGTELIEFAYDVFTGVSVDFTADLTPTGETTFSGVTWLVDDDRVDAEGDLALVALTGEGEQPVEATFVGAWDSKMDLVLTPTLSVCVLSSCIDLASFDIPLTIASDAFEQAFVPSGMAFPLPVLSTDVVEHDFGKVDMGGIANMELPIANLGELDLEGAPTVTGSNYFSMYPEYFQAGPGHEDGLVVTFAPQTAGEFDATLMLLSNDPGAPSYAIALHGVGIDPYAEDDGGADDGEQLTTQHQEVGGCGCATSGSSRSLALAGLLAGLSLLARRRHAAR